MPGIYDYLDDRNGVLAVDGISSTDLAARFGTPLYVYSARRIRDNYRRIHGAFSALRENFRTNYAVKANSNLSVLEILRKEGAGADCASPAEILIAKTAGFPADRLLYSGNYNSDEELRYGLESGAVINLDDGPLLGRLLRFGRPEALCFRINPGFGMGKSPGVVTAGPDAKFGMRERDALKAYRLAKEAGIERLGVHMMAGSNVLETTYWAAITDRLTGIATRIAKALRIRLDFIDLGGGFGVPDRIGEKGLPIRELAQKIVGAYERKLAQNPGIGDPTLVIEPGRYLVGDAGVLLASVTHVKTSAKKFVGCDAGMNTLLRPALYGAYHEILPATKLDARRSVTVNVTGQICENTDILGKARKLPALDQGDLLAFLNAGAYGYTMASRYNSRPLPAEVLIEDGQARLVRERERLADLMRGQMAPQGSG
ncbi:MAG TPA: diaminopimelate decarboxylase [Thermoplasmata archaeon]|nr:diaminopimelate decarboxylase [Thermoplasmata archaeon]